MFANNDPGDLSMNYVVKNFLRGLAIVVPFTVTIYVVYQILLWIDRLIVLPYPGLGALVLVVGVTLIGGLASSFIVRKVLEVPDAIFTRAPIVRIIYTSIKELTEAFVGDRRRFSRPVLVELIPGSDVQAVGFVTREELTSLGVSGRVAVYFPQSYNIAGNLVLLPADRVRPLEIESARAMAFIMSGGVAGLGDEPENRAGA
jgi:uncharacterized membrane protein